MAAIRCGFFEIDNANTTSNTETPAPPEIIHHHFPQNNYNTPKKRPNDQQHNSQTKEKERQNNGIAVPKPTSVWDLLQLENKNKQHQLYLLQPGKNHGLSTKNIPLGLGITEISGEAGTGKTQLCLGLCISCITSTISPMPSPKIPCGIRNPYAKTSSPPKRTAIYITLGNENNISKRLHQMVVSRNLSSQILSRIYIKSIANEDDLEDYVFSETQLPFVLGNDPTIRLIVLDSIGALFRSSDESIPKRSAFFFRLSSQFKRWSSLHNIPFCVINQVSYSIPRERIVPSLGLSWSCCVDSRFLVRRWEEGGGTKFGRSLRVVLSSCLPPLEVGFVIDATGCCAVD